MEYNKKLKVAVVGAGPAGCTCAYFAQEKFEVSLFDSKSPLLTILPTGNGRCNLAYAEYDFRELAKFYPRGEKFLYSVFSQFATADTLDFFQKIGVETYMQDDFRFFPTSNSSKDVREKFLKSIRKSKIFKEKITSIEKLEEGFCLKSDSASYYFDKVVIATGGHAGFELARKLGHKIIEPKPALVGLVTKENFKSLQGVSLKSVEAQIFWGSKKFAPLSGDLIFTHEGISGPLAYVLSSVCARVDYDSKQPLLVELKLLEDDFDMQTLLNQNSKKDFKNLLSEFTLKSIVEYVLKTNNIPFDIKCHQVNSKIRELVFNSLNSFLLTVVSPSKEGEVVMSGGVTLDEINPKTMESKLVKGLYFCGEVIDVDGLCGGFNLQNCWSTGFIAGEMGLNL